MFKLLGALLRGVVIPFCMNAVALQYYVILGLWSLLYKIYSVLSVVTRNQKYWLQMARDVPLPHPDVYRDSIDIIAAQGYHLEIHTIKTEDNYLLKAWRLNKDPLRRGTPVMVQHGLLDCSWSWFLNNDKNTTLPYLLCEQGYDVWVTNNRGNKYSLGHTTLTDCGYNPQYWDFSFDEIVKFDVSAIVNHIKKVTQKPKLHYIGHSQGTSQIFAKICEDPKFQEHLISFVALGPAIFVSNQRSKIVNWIIRLKFIEVLHWMDHPSFFCFSDQDNTRIGALCYLFRPAFQGMLFAIVNLLCGLPNKNKIDMKRFGVMVAHEPGGASTRNLIHWLQFIQTGRFQKYDFGAEENLNRYGSVLPPEYDTSNLIKFNIPRYLFIGEKDIICDETDVDKLINRLEPKGLQVEHITDYAHLDYVWSVDAHQKIYCKVIDFLNKLQ